MLLGCLGRRQLDVGGWRKSGKGEPPCAVITPIRKCYGTTSGVPSRFLKFDEIFMTNEHEWEYCSGVDVIRGQ